MSSILALVLTALAGLVAATIIFIGVRFLLWPRTAADGFGVPAVDGAKAYLSAKGVRDIVSGLVVITLLIARQRLALGLFLMVAALIPVGDMVIVLRNKGRAAVAFGVHGATAVLLVLVGLGIAVGN